MDTIAAISTGAQVTAIGIVRLSGDKTLYAVDELFRPFSGRRMSSYEDRKLVFGNLCDRNGEVLDVCLCTISRGPNSYTGEDTAEFQCHGSPVMLRCVLDELFALGLRQAGPGEFTKRSFLNGKNDLISAEAVADLIDAENIESVKNAAGQLQGAISGELDGIYSDLMDISSHFHAVLDYPDEDIEDFEMQQYEGTIRNAISRLRSMLDTFERGKLMKAGIPTAIIGKPNAGKSSLMNSLLGYDRAIVTDIPGTTRDTIEETVRMGKLTLRLIDTAGIRETDDVVEKLGVERSLSAVRSAALVLALVDSSVPMTEEDREILAYAEAAPKSIVICSKADLPCVQETISTQAPVIRVSSVSREGFLQLEEAIAELFPLPEVPAGGILTNVRHADAIRRALEYLNASEQAMAGFMTPDIVLTETEGAMQAIAELTGKAIHEDITNRIFSRFCVGK